MVHVGEQRFYEEAYAEAFSHDVALVEGIQSAIGRHLTRSYRWLDLMKLGLVLQPRTPPQAAVTARIVNADLSAEEFRHEWRKISLVHRGLIYLLAPLVGIHRRLFTSREILARDMSLEDRKSAEENLSWSPTLEPMTNAILHARDGRLIKCLETELGESMLAGERIAIVYGASHMRAVIRALSSHGFNSSGASWRTIMSV